MTSRERILAIVIGTAIVLGLGYMGVNKFFVQKMKDTRDKITKYTNDKQRIQQTLDSRESLSRRWLNYTARTFSLDKTEAHGNFGKALKQIAKDHGFEDAVFSPAAGTKIGTKTDITTVAHRITVEGQYEKVTGLLRDLYQTPFLCQITKLSVLPLGAKASRDVVKVEFTIEAPLLPVVDEQKIPYVRGAKAMIEGGEALSGPARAFARADEYFRILDERNIFRSYLAPPENVVLIDNQDRKMTALKVKFFWENKVSREMVETVGGKSSLPIKGPGNVVEIAGTYADGVTFGPKRLTFEGEKKDWSYVVEAHSPPTIVDLEVKNESGGTAYVDVTVTDEDNRPKTGPALAFFSPGAMDLGVYENVKSVKISVKYPSGMTGLSKTFQPQEGKQTLTIGPEPAEPLPPNPEGDVPIPVPDVPDDPPDMSKTVTGLVYYPDPGGKNELVQEMIATAGDGGRTIMRVGEEGAVDGGTLVAVVPALGGIVKMSKTGNYYIYPLGRKFTGRNQLTARSEQDLPAAIDLWTSR